MKEVNLLHRIKLDRTESKFGGVLNRDLKAAIRHRSALYTMTEVAEKVTQQLRFWVKNHYDRWQNLEIWLKATWNTWHECKKLAPRFSDPTYYGRWFDIITQPRASLFYYPCKQSTSPCAYPPKWPSCSFLLSFSAEDRYAKLRTTTAAAPSRAAYARFPSVLPDGKILCPPSAIQPGAIHGKNRITFCSVA